MIEDIRWAPLASHLLYFVILVTVSTVVYQGLRRESVAEILVVGLRRAAVLVGLSVAIFGLGFLLLAEWV